MGWLRLALRGSYRLAGVLPLPIRARRGWVELLARGNPGRSGVSVDRVRMAGVEADRVGTGTAASPAILFLHGGSYAFNSARVYRSLTTALAAESGATVYAPDYRRAPEHPFPAARDDALASYRWLLDRGHRPESVALAGDSAGGGLCLATAIALREGKLPSPTALALISPWVDLTLSGRSVREKAGVDVVLSASGLAEAGDWYRGELPPGDPQVSPLNAHLAGLPPLLVQAATDDILASDSERFAERAAAAGVDVELELYEGLFHDFQLHERRLSVAREAVERIAAFVRRHWSGI
jgi:monoterpene epsilon-lactone hydrolase